MSAEAASSIVDQVATAILSETPANYVTQNIAQAYRNAEIALEIIEPAIRADERERIYGDMKATKDDIQLLLREERQRIAAAIEAERDQVMLMGNKTLSHGLLRAARIARSGGKE